MPFPVTTTVTRPLGTFGSVTLTVNQYEMSCESSTSPLAIVVPPGTWRVYAWISAKPTDGWFPARYDSGAVTFASGGTINLPALYLRSYLELDAGAGEILFGVTVYQQLANGNWHPYTTTWASEAGSSVTVPAAPAARTSGILWGADSNWIVFSGAPAALGPMPNIASIMNQIASAAPGGLLRVNMQWWALCPTGTQGGATVMDATVQGYYDTVFNAVAAAGMKALVALGGGTPAWAATGGTMSAPPVNWTDYTNFVNAILTRWGTKIGAVEGGINEANGFAAAGASWAPTGAVRTDGSPSLSSLGWTLAKMATQLGNLHTAAKAYSSVMPVGCDAIAFADEVWLASLYATTGWAGNWDYISVHPYPIRFDYADGRGGVNWGLGKGAVRPWGDSGNGNRCDLIAGLANLYKVMVSHGDGAKQLWVTEYGWNTVASGSVGVMGGFDAGEPEYATRIRTAMRQAARLPYLGAFLVWSAHDQGSYPSGSYGPAPGSGTTNFFGLLDMLGTRQKAGYTAFKQAISDIAAGAA